MEKNIKALCLKENDSIEKALQIIGKKEARIAFVLKNEKLLGIITDADIRHALLKGFTIKSSIKKIYKKDFFSLDENSSKREILQYCAKYNIYDFPVLKAGKLVAVHSLNKLISLEKGQNTRVVLMAGGLGKRLRPLTKSLPKPMLKISNKPILEHILLNLKEQGFYDFTLCVNYKKDLIKKYFKNGAKLGIKISYIEEQEPLGTAGALAFIEQKRADLIIMNADILTKLDFSSFLKAHKESKAEFSLGLRRLNHSFAFGVVNCKDGFVENIEEKPNYSFLINAGIYAIKAKLLKKLKKNSYMDMPDFIKLCLLENIKIKSYIFDDFWLDIGNPKDYEKAKSF